MTKSNRGEAPPKGASTKPPKATHSKLAWVLFTFLLTGTFLGIAAPIAIKTSYRFVSRTVETGDRASGNWSIGTVSTREPAPVQFYLGWGAAGLAGLAGLAVIVVAFLWLARAWAVIPEAHGGMSPVKAIGLLFVPFFNLYWMFRVVPGLSTALAATLKSRYPERSFPTGYGAGMAACVAVLIPGLNLLSPLLLLGWFSAADRAASRLRASE